MADRQNFSWGVTGKGTEGVDWGNTNNWTDQQWSDYDKKYPSQSGGDKADTGTSGSDAGSAAKPTTSTNTTPGSMTQGAAQPPATGQMAQDTGWGAGTAQSPSGSPTQQALLEQLLVRTGQFPTQLNADDPNVKAKVDAYRAEQEREKNQYLSQAAEAGSPYSTGQQANLERMMAEKEAQNVGQYQSDAADKASADTLSRYQAIGENSRAFAQLAEQGNIADMNNAMDQAKLSQQDKEFLLSLAQQGKYADMAEEFKRMQLAQDQNQFVAKLAQEGQIASMDDMFRRMQLMQEQSQFLDRLGFDTQQQNNYWDWQQRGNG